ncbi:MAG: hypothetical protein V3V31_10655 [Methylococcales bacterium]
MLDNHDTGIQDLHSLDKLQASLFLILSYYVEHPNPLTARGVIDHLNLLGKHPDINALPMQKKLYEKMRFNWEVRTFEDTEQQAREQQKIPSDETASAVWH